MPPAFSFSSTRGPAAEAILENALHVLQINPGSSPDPVFIFRSFSKITKPLSVNIFLLVIQNGKCYT
jgi:hypothetical protein